MKTRDSWEKWVEQALGAPHLHEPGRGTLHRALSLGDRLERKKRIGAWIIEAVFDSAGSWAPVGVRGTGVSGERRILYQCEAASGGGPGHQLDLKLRTRPEGEVEVTGQFLPPWPEARIEVRAGRVRRVRTLGSAGEFLLRGLPASATTMTLSIRAKDQEDLEIKGIPLSPGSEK